LRIGGIAEGRAAGHRAVLHRKCQIGSATKNAESFAAARRRAPD